MHRYTYVRVYACKTLTSLQRVDGIRYDTCPTLRGLNPPILSVSLPLALSHSPLSYTIPPVTGVGAFSLNPRPPVHSFMSSPWHTSSFLHTNGDNHPTSTYMQAWEREHAGDGMEEEDWDLEEEEQGLLEAVRAKKKARFCCVLCAVYFGEGERGSMYV